MSLLFQEQRTAVTTGFEEMHRLTWGLCLDDWEYNNRLRDQAKIDKMARKLDELEQRIAAQRKRLQEASKDE